MILRFPCDGCHKLKHPKIYIPCLLARHRWHQSRNKILMNMMMMLLTAALAALMGVMGNLKTKRLMMRSGAKTFQANPSLGPQIHCPFLDMTIQFHGWKPPWPCPPIQLQRRPLVLHRDRPRILCPLLCLCLVHQKATLRDNESKCLMNH